VTLGKIANEKAGIIKQQIPVVIGETLPATKQIFEAKAGLKRPLYFAESYEIIGTTYQLINLKLHLRSITGPVTPGSQASTSI
jgi:folylpolyglutamate synthase/dihydropteroate synthase